MFKSISRNNRLFALGNFIFALSYGLWMNLRQIHLLDMGASPAEIGTVFALISIAGGLLPLPAGLLTDRIGPKRVILASWLIAFTGTLIAALAQTWLSAGVGYIFFMLCIAANPATVSYVLLNTRDHDREGSAESVMATVFISWPAAMVFAPALGGLIADKLNIQTDLWIGAVGLLAAVAVFSLAEDTQPAGSQGGSNPLRLVKNRQYLMLAMYFTLALMAMHIGFILAPTYLEDARSTSTGLIGILFSISSVGMLLFRNVVIAFRPRLSFVILVVAACLGTLILWLTTSEVWTGAAFLLLGGISTTWVVMQASIGRSVPVHMRGLALGVTESLYYGGVALASWVAGQLYGYTSAHELPFIYGLAAMLLVIALAAIVPFGRQTSETNLKVDAAAQETGS